VAGVKTFIRERGQKANIFNDYTRVAERRWVRDSDGVREIEVGPLALGRAATGRKQCNKWGQVLGFVVARLRNSRKTERGAGQFLVRSAVRAAPFALLRNSRKTERGAGQLLVGFAVRAAPFALPSGRGSVFVSAYMLSDAL
jgi:hypothetical protein